MDQGLGAKPPASWSSGAPRLPAGLHSTRPWCLRAETPSQSLENMPLFWWAVAGRRPERAGLALEGGALRRSFRGASTSRTR